MPIDRDILRALHEKVRSGSGHEVRDYLLEAKHERIPRRHLAEVAELLRRVHCFSEALRLLHPVVWSGERIASTALSKERLEYATALTFLGAPRSELERILDAIGEDEFPQKLLIWTSHHVARWDYGGSIPLLERYIAHAGIDDYLRLVGRVNLLSALVVERRGEAAQQLADELLGAALGPKLGLMKASVLTLAARNHIHQARYADAHRLLREAENCVAGQRSVESLSLRKWTAVARLYEGSRGAAEDLEKVRQAADEGRNWEMARSCDFHLAAALGEEAAFQKAYVGTPFGAFRALLKRVFPGPVAIPTSFTWGEPRAETELDLEAHDVMQAPLRLLVLLTADFFRPLRTAQIHWGIYQSVFDPTSSSLRVRKVVQRLREKIARERWPMRIVRSSAGYRLSLDAGMAIRVPCDRDTLLGRDRLSRLVQTYAGKDFSAKEVAAAFALPMRTAQWLLKTGMEREIIVKRGKGRATIYSIGTGDLPRLARKKA